MAGVIAAAVLLAVSAGLKLLVARGLVPAEAAPRGTQALIGLMLAAYGNYMPKVLGSLANPAVAARTQLALRIGGWAFALAGLAYAALWAFAPIGLADALSIPVIAAAMAATLLSAGRLGWACLVR
jgi:hypothetical protein